MSPASKESQQYPFGPGRGVDSCQTGGIQEAAVMQSGADEVGSTVGGCAYKQATVGHKVVNLEQETAANKQQQQQQHDQVKRKLDNFIHHSTRVVNCRYCHNCCEVDRRAFKSNPDGRYLQDSLNQGDGLSGARGSEEHVGARTALPRQDPPYCLPLGGVQVPVEEVPFAGLRW